MHKSFFLETLLSRIYFTFAKKQKQNAFSPGYPEIGKRIH